MEKRKLVLSVIITALVTSLVTFTFCGFLAVSGDAVDQKISLVRDLLEEQGLYDVDEEKIADYAAMGIALSVEDPYTVYYPKAEFSAFRDEITTTYVGVGATIGVSSDGNNLMVVSPMEDSPAEKAGLKSGDIILAIDGNTYSATQLSDAATYLKNGDIGSKVTVTVLRDGKGKLDIEITRDKVVKKTVKSEMVTEDVGYLRITGFESKGAEGERSTYEEFAEHLSGLKSAGMKKLVIDLRDNPGGDLSVVCNIADVFLPKGIITYTEDKNGERMTIESDSNELSVPIVVLVNGGSASASEVLIGALKDYKKAIVIGTKTYGKGIVQTVFPFTDGSGISITTAKYYTPSGVCIHGIGIEPDIVVEPISDKAISELTLDEDSQLKKALEILK